MASIPNIAKVRKAGMGCAANQLLGVAKVLVHHAVENRG